MPSDQHDAASTPNNFASPYVVVMNTVTRSGCICTRRMSSRSADLRITSLIARGAHYVRFPAFTPIPPALPLLPTPS